MSWRARFQKLLRMLLKGSAKDNPPEDPVSAGAPKDERLSGNVKRDVARIEELFGQSNELVTRWIQNVQSQNKPTAVMFIDGMVNTAAIAEYVIAPLHPDEAGQADGPSSADKADINTTQAALDALNYGKCLLLRQGEGTVAFDVRYWAKRQVDRAQIEPTEFGSQEGFVEDLATNIVLMRRRLRTSKFQTERLMIGRESRTDVRIMYLKGIARESLVEEVRGRLSEIDIDAVVGSNAIVELTSDTPWSPFPNAIVTGRPDRTAAMILEGYVAVMSDGSPMAMIAPGTLTGLLQASDDYDSNFYIASFTRTIRWLAALIGLLTSSIYVSIISYHHEMIPSRLLFTIASGREGVSFPPVMEAFLMEFAFEMLREAGLRVPMKVGQAVSIVGVLVIGDAAVRAGLVSPLMIVVVGMTAISTFAVPSLQLADTLRLLRFPLIMLAGFLGLIGVTFGLMLLGAILISSRSFGVPYTAPFIPLWRKGLADGMMRAPMWRQQFRPWHMVQPGKVRQQPPGQRPRPEQTETEKKHS